MTERKNPYKISELTINKLTEKVENKSSVKTDRELIEKALIEIEKRVNQGGDIPGMQTGIKDLDKATGGFEKGELNIIAARPSIGKTVMALNLLDGLSQNGYKVFLAELEMTEESLGIRRLANNATVEVNRIKFGNMQQEDFNKILQAASILGNRNNIFTDCTSNQSLLNIKSKAKAIRQSHGLDVIIIDNLTIMNIPNRQTRDVAIGEITKGLKSLAKDLEISVILLCQLSRAPEQRADHRPMLSDLRESGNIEQDADTVIMLYRDEYYNKETEDKNIMECIITKQRNGATGTVRLFYSSDYQRIY
nr:MAG TPA: DnaB-like replicative helicase [Caudoviricetes sp.]